MTDTTIEPTDTVDDAKTWLRAQVDEGAHCPVCTQFAKTYRRKIHAAMARDLIRVWRTAGGSEFHVRTVLGHDGGDFAKLSYWGLIEAVEGVRDDGSRRTGWWRITSTGVAWINDTTTVPKYGRIYDGTCLNLYGDPQSIRDALGTRFSYDDLMRGE